MEIIPEYPTNIRERLSNLIKSNSFGELVELTQHELIHRLQGLENKSKKEFRDIYELCEAQAYRNVLIKTCVTYGVGSMAEELLKQIGVENLFMLQQFDQETKTRGNDIFFKKVKKAQKEYKPFNKDKLIYSLGALDKLTALGKTDVEIAELIGSKTIKWDKDKACYVEVEEAIQNILRKKGYTEDDLENLVLAYKIRRRINHNRSFVKVAQEFDRAVGKMEI